MTTGITNSFPPVL